MNTSHTPGPWELVRTEKGELELGGGIEQSTGVYSAVGFGLVANVIYKKTNILGDSKVLQKQTFEANAKLIATAPDMLEVCEYLVKAAELQEALQDMIPFTINLAREAIKKATS